MKRKSGNRFGDGKTCGKKSAPILNALGRRSPERSESKKVRKEGGHE